MFEIGGVAEGDTEGDTESAPAELLRCLSGPLAALTDRAFSAQDGSAGHDSDSDLISAIELLERTKSAASALQARLTAKFVERQSAEAKRLHEVASACSDAGDFEGWVAARDEAYSRELPPAPLSANCRGGQTAAHQGVHDADASVGSRSARRRMRSLMVRTGVSAQIGLARHDSPARGARHAHLAVALTTVLPRTLDALALGHLSERRAELIAQATSHLCPDQRRLVDAEVVGENWPTKLNPGIAAWGDRMVERRVKACTDRLDPEAAVERARAAAATRHVATRPLPDCMAALSAVLPLTQAVGVHAALDRAAATAKAAGDDRSRGQVMADTLFERVTGQSASEPIDLELRIVITDRALMLGDATPAHIPGYGSVPAAYAMELIATMGALDAAGPASDTKGDTRGDRSAAAQVTEQPSTTSEDARLWYRRLYTHPDNGTLVAMESTRRIFPDQLRDFLIARDDTCRTPWCDAPVRQADHVEPHARGGPTSSANGQGLCVRCNLTKDLPGWQSTVVSPGALAGEPPPVVSYPDDPHTVRITTPTGHSHLSVAPPVLPGSGPGRVRRPDLRFLSQFERELFRLAC